MAALPADVTRDQARAIQQVLNDVTGSKLTIDGLFGPASFAALQKYQIQMNIPVSGLYDTATRVLVERDMRSYVPTATGGKFTTTPEQLTRAFGISAGVAGIWADPLNAAMARFRIANKTDGCAFLAQIAHETALLAVLAENLNYSADGLANTWPTRYAAKDANGNYVTIVVGTGTMAKTRKAPNDLANRLQRNPQAIANNTYANRMGNGDEASGDGWKNRGQGPIQLTGATNIGRCGDAIGIDLRTDPSKLQQPVAGSLSAAWFWSVNNVSKYGAVGDFDSTCKIVNIGNVDGNINDVVGLADRRQKYQAALTVY